MWLETSPSGRGISGKSIYDFGMNLPVSAVRRKTWLDIFLAGFLFALCLCFVPVLIAGALVEWGKSAFGVALPVMPMCWSLFGIVLAGYPLVSIRNGALIREIRVEANTITLVKFMGQPEILHKPEIRNVRWVKDKLVFERDGNPFSIRVQDRAMTSVLYFWMPEHVLPSGIQPFVIEAKAQAKHPSPIFETPLRPDVKPVMFSGVVELSNQGLIYTTLLGEQFIAWNDIEAAEMKPNGKSVKVWVNGRYRRIKLNKKQAILSESFVIQLQTRGIPVSYAIT